MTTMTLILCTKIILTLFTVVLPFLMFPVAKLDAVMQVQAKSAALYRLYGVAVLALLVGYAGGLWQVSNGVFPLGVVCMGIASNGGAFATLLLTGFAKQQRFLTLFFGLIASALIWALLVSETAMKPLI